MIPPEVSYFAWFGTLVLAILTVQDYRNNKLVDDRRNWFMAGLAISVATHIDITLLYLLAVSVVSGVFIALGTKYLSGMVGGADISSISWSILGFGLINPFSLAVYFVVFGLLTSLTLVLLKTFKQKESIPFYPVLLTSFFITCLLLGGYSLVL